MFLFLFHFIGGESLKNICGTQIIVISPFLYHQYKMLEGFIKGSKQLSDHQMICDIGSTKINQLAGENGESVVGGLNSFTVLASESIELASKRINSCIFLCRSTFTNIFKIIPNTFGRSNVPHFQVLLSRNVISDEYSDFRIKSHTFELISSDIFLVLDDNSIHDNFPTSQIDSNNIPHHLV